MQGAQVLADILRKNEAEILQEWVREQTADGAVRRELLREDDLRGPCRTFLKLFADAVARAQSTRVAGAAEWAEVRTMLADLSRLRGQQGFSPSETATFVFSLKRPLFDRISRTLVKEPEKLAETTWSATEVLDGLGLYTTEVYQKSREDLIIRQQQDLLELSTPVVKLFDGVVALPLIGTLDSRRTQVVMESLLDAITQTGSDIAIIDITGVPTVDTLVAQHLMKTVAAARLMGAECIISGIRPQIAQTIVHLAIDLGSVTTKANLANALLLALRRRGLTLARTQASTAVRTAGVTIPAAPAVSGNHNLGIN
jgi:rsbT co-antagonist protein RsbR